MGGATAFSCRALCLTLAALLTACGGMDGTAMSPGSLPRMSSIVTPEAQRFLDADGRFLVQPAVDPADMSASAAEDLALAWVRDYARFNRSSLERSHGGPIDFVALRPCG